MKLIVETFAAVKTNNGMLAGLGLWITVQAARLNWWKAQLQAAQVPVHCRGLRCQDLALSCINRIWRNKDVEIGGS